MFPRLTDGLLCCGSDLQQQNRNIQVNDLLSWRVAQWAVVKIQLIWPFTAEGIEGWPFNGKRGADYRF